MPTYEVKFRATDSAGRAAELVRSFFIDTTPPVVYSRFDPSRKQARITLSQGDMQANYSTPNDLTGSVVFSRRKYTAAQLTNGQRLAFEAVVTQTAGRVYIGGSGNVAGQPPLTALPSDEAGMSSVVFNGNGGEALYARGGVGSIQPPVTLAYGDRIGIVCEISKPDEANFRIQAYKNGALFYTSLYNIVAANAELTFFVGEGGTTGAANSFVTRIYTDPATMLHFANYNAQPWVE